MSFILRAAFWLTVLAFLLPAAGYETDPQPAGMEGYSAAALVTGATPPTEDIGAGEALTLSARSALVVMGFCVRNRDFWGLRHAIVGDVVGQTAHYGGMALTWLTEKAREHKQGAAAGSQPAAIRPAPSNGYTTGA